MQLYNKNMNSIRPGLKDLPNYPELFFLLSFSFIIKQRSLLWIHLLSNRIKHIHQTVLSGCLCFI